MAKARKRNKAARAVGAAVARDARSGTLGRGVAPGGRSTRVIYEGDPDQRPVVHDRVEDTLDRLLRKEEISRAMFDAGRAFEAHFRRAHMTGYALSRMDGMGGRGAREDLTAAQMRARDLVWAALRCCGAGGSGGMSPPASVAWHVVGLGETLNQWATRQQCNGRAMRADVAKGVLVASLSVLAGHFGFNQK